MKALFTLLVILFASAIALAQNPQQNDKVDIIEMGIVMVSGLSNTNDTKTFSINTETSVARLYKSKNSRVNRALAFITKTNYSKLA
ncbi:hypothetical protein [Maribacter sp. ACAM166]|uniref:hypothetical protein n=1 Tax=Maribacter sp. ACAM166 TaxID=2508996 RepID=UPI0010FE2A83|nr:hypothetical protein [Maribacter sp. ACAM166]TLP76737.1 hypothetical protein ES765_14045 [Maribacter sp. ACAM166]